MSAHETQAEIHRFTPTALFICGGMLIWATDFLALYVIAAIACAKGFASITLAGLPIVAFIGTMLTVCAVVGTIVLLRVGLRRLARNGQLDDSRRFIYFLVSAIGMLALIAILYNALPAWWLATECGR